MDPTIRKVSEDTSGPETEPNRNTFYSLRKSPGSTPDLSTSAFSTVSAEESKSKHATPRAITDLLTWLP